MRLYRVPLAIHCIYGYHDGGGENGMGGMGVRFLGERREWRLPTDDSVLYGELEKALKVMVFLVELCRRRGLKVNADKSNVMVLGGEEGLECEIYVDGAWHDLSKCQSSHIWGLFWMNQVQMLPTIVGRW